MSRPADVDRRGAWRDLGSAVLAFLAMPVLALLALTALAGIDPAGPDGEVPLGPALAAQFAGSLVVLLLAMRLHRPGPLGSGLLAVPPLYLLFLVGFVPVAFVLLPWLWQQAGLPLEPQTHLVWFLEDRPPGLWWVGLATVTLIGPVYEEVVFRGYLLRGLRPLVGAGAAVWLSALLFGLVHVGSGWFLVLPLTLLGAFLGWLRLRFDGLLAPCFAHVLHNSLVIAFTLSAPHLLDAVYRQDG